jgi:hydroxymethylbilane synthase
LSALRLGTRGSALALAQARWVASRFDGPVEIVEVTTAGDLARDYPASPVPGRLRRGAPAGDPGDKSRWTGALERALLAGEIDIAVHSAKDVPRELAEGTEIVAVPPREDPRDVVVGDLFVGARVGTSSLRRRAQLLAVRPDLDVVELRGNVDTRLRKLAAGEVDALVLAAAGLARLGRDDVAYVPLEGDVFVPAPGQGFLLVQGRAGTDFGIEGGSAGRAGSDRGAAAAAGSLLDAVDDPAARAALMAERAVVARLDASCNTPIGVCHRSGRIAGFVGLPDGSEWLIDEARDADALADRMLSAGAADLLARAEHAA